MQLRIREWLNEFTEHVCEVDYESARKMFHPGVIGYGSHTNVVYSIDNLILKQWQKIWPHIDHFSFDYDRLECDLSDDECLASVRTKWTTTGYRPDGTSFNRPGRVTIVLVRDNTASAWKAKHTHFSLDPGTPTNTQRKVPKLPKEAAACL